MAMLLHCHYTLIADAADAAADIAAAAALGNLELTATGRVWR